MKLAELADMQASLKARREAIGVSQSEAATLLGHKSKETYIRQENYGRMDVAELLQLSGGLRVLERLKGQGVNLQQIAKGQFCG